MLCEVLCVIGVFVFSFDVLAQETNILGKKENTPYFNYSDSWSADSLEVLQNYSLYRELYKQNVVEEALPC